MIPVPETCSNIQVTVPVSIVTAPVNDYQERSKVAYPALSGNQNHSMKVRFLYVKVKKKVINSILPIFRDRSFVRKPEPGLQDTEE
jgi:hypothetical protein